MKLTQEQFDQHQRRHGFVAPVAPPSPAPSPEQPTKWQKGQERQMHDLFEKDLRRRQWPFVHSRFDKASTIAKGWPDFTVLLGQRAVCIEFKAEGGKVDPDQRERISELQAAGVPVLVAYDLQSAIDFTVRALTGPDATTEEG